MKPSTTIAAIILGVISLLHLLRVLFGWALIIGTTGIPMWPSIVVFLVFGILATMLWRDSRGERPEPPKM